MDDKCKLSLTQMIVRKVNVQISLGIHTIRSESSLCAKWVTKDSILLHVESEDSDQMERVPRLILIFA